MKFQTKGFVAGILTASILMFSFNGYAENITKMVEVAFNSINIQVNGVKVDADNILYNDTTYIPLRSISKMLDKEVVWDDNTNTANINDINSVSSKPVYPNGYQEISYPDGSKYIGEVNNGKRNGYGTYYYPEKDVNNRLRYDGQWIDDKRNGHGILAWKDGSSSASLDWKDDGITGYIVEKFKDNSYYCGFLNNNIREKIGIISYNNNMLSLGQFSNNYLNGYGLFIDNSKKYFVEYENDLIKNLAFDINNNSNSTIIYNPSQYPNPNTTIPTPSPVSPSPTQNTEYLNIRKAQYEKELSDIQTQIANVKANKSVKIMVKKVDGTFDYDYTYDQSMVEILEKKHEQTLTNYNAWKAMYNIN